jgi:ribosomal protein S18 acetylase RimI-like enzyme
MIVPLGVEHVHRVARLHCSCLTGLLSLLGQRAAEAFYAGCTRAESATAFVCLEEGEIQGFVVGSICPGRLKSEVVRQNTLGILSGICLGVLRRPAALRWLVKSFSGPDEGSYDAGAPELTYLAVAEERRGSGIGKQLVEAFTAAMRAAGVPAYALSVDAGNRQAVAFYESLGFLPAGSYREFGLLHRRYRLDLHPAGAAAQGLPELRTRT